MAWNLFRLSSSVKVIAGQDYAFHLSPAVNTDYSAKATVTYRIGVLVADVYQRGTNDFSVPGYDYTFKIFMLTSPDSSALFADDATVDPGVLSNNVDQSDSSKSGASFSSAETSIPDQTVRLSRLVALLII